MKQELQLLWRNAGARVGDLDAESRRRHGGEGHRHPTCRPVVLDGVREQVQQNLREALPIGEHRLIGIPQRLNIERDPTLRGERPDQMDDALYHIVNRNRLW